MQLARKVAGIINYAQLAVHKPRSLYAAIEVLGLLQRFVSCGIIRASIKIRFADGGCQHVYHADIPLKYRERIVAEFLKKPLKLLVAFRPLFKIRPAVKRPPITEHNGFCMAVDMRNTLE